MGISNKRLEAIFLGLFVMMAGGFWLVPSGQLPPSFWSIGAGLILLGLNAARYASRIAVSEVTIGLGGMLLLGGLVDYTGGPYPVLPIAAILAGLVLVARNLLRRPGGEKE